MQKKIIGYNRLPKEIFEDLQKHFDVEYFESIDPKTDPNFLQSLKTAEGIIGLSLQVDKELLDNAPKLKIVSNISTGYNNLDIEEMTKRHIMATNTPGVLEDTTADAIFGILIAAARRIAELDAYVKQKRWKHELKEHQYGIDVHHKKLGIIGLGKIGSLIAKRGALGFDMDILYYNRTRNIDAERKFKASYCDNLEPLLKSSDFVCLMTPLTEETYHMIGEKEFKKMKSTAIFVNGSRGSTVDEQALIQALINKEIRGAALDVYKEEPINENNPLLHMTNVVTTPHLGSSTIKTEREMALLAAKNIKKGLNGERPPSLINEEVWDK